MPNINQMLYGDRETESEIDMTQFQEFTPDEQKCISDKIPKLMDEGKSQDQAIAQAISMCTNGEKSKPVHAGSMDSG